MLCPECASDKVGVLDSRPKKGAIVRRRKCECGHRFNTVERPVEAIVERYKWQVGDYVSVKGAARWRGRVVGHFEISGTVFCCVESSFEPGSVQHFRETKLLPWEPREASRRIIWTPEMVATLRNLRAENFGYLDCEMKIGVSSSVIAQKCKELGIDGKRNAGRKPGRELLKDAA